MAFVDTRIRSLETARRCAQLGACPRTIGWVTGLPGNFILERVFGPGHRAPRGRPPYTEDLVFRTPFKVQAELGSFAATYRSLTAAGFTPAASLIAAYEHYLSFTPLPSFSFDEAFFLVSNLDGIWACRAATLQLEPCARCSARRLVPLGDVYTPACAFCREACAERGSRPRVAGRVADRSEPIGVCIGLQDQIDALRTRRALESVGAHPRVMAAILAACPGTGRRAPTKPLHVGKALPVARWSTSVRTLRRAQFSVVAATFHRLVEGGIAPEAAIVAAFRHVVAVFHRVPPPSFDRCFEVVCQVEGRWGVATPALRLVDCRRCGAACLEGTTDPGPRSCPFCLLLHHADLYLPPAEPADPPDSAAVST